MAELSRLEILSYHGFKRDPFKGHDFETADRARIRRLVSMAAADNTMMAVVGMRGMGKTRSVVDAVRRLALHPVVIDFPDQGRLLIGDIERTLIRELSDETPRRSKDARKPQLRRVIGEASRRQRIVVVIEEAHRIHPSTLRALKSLRTLDWMGQDELFACILIGQSDPLHKPGVAEVRLRADSVQMQGMTAGEAADYVTTSLGDVVAPGVAKRVAGLAGSRNFLDLQFLLVGLMGAAMADGRSRVEISDVEDMVRVSRRQETGERPDAKAGQKAGNSAIGRVLAGRGGDAEELRAAV